MQLQLVSLGVIGVLLVALATVIPEGTGNTQPQNEGKEEPRYTKKLRFTTRNKIKKTKTIANATVELDKRQEQGEVVRKLVQMSFGTKFCDQCMKYIGYTSTNSFKIKVAVKVGCRNFLDPKICNHIFRVEGEFFKVMKKNKNNPQNVCKQFGLC